MKNWQHTLLWLLISMIATAVIFLVTAPPRGTSVELLPAPTPAPIMVHVDGAVQQPGVYALPRDNRVQDAIQAAGGVSPKANTGAINLAARLQDGDKLTIPEVGTPAALPVLSEPYTGRSENLTESTPAAVVNLNTASLEELQILPGIGAARAKDIIAYRQEHGGFKSIEDLKDVTGIGEATYDRLKHLITVN